MVDRPPARLEMTDASGKGAGATPKFHDELLKMNVGGGTKGGAAEACTGIEYVQGRLFNEYRAQENDVSGSITLRAEDNKSFAVFEPDKEGRRGRCLYVRDRSGATFTPTEGGVAMRRFNGDEQLYPGATIDSHGTISYPDADGLQRQRFLDGSNAKLLPDGSTETIRPDGLRKTQKRISDNELLTSEMIAEKKIEVRNFSNPQNLTSISLNPNSDGQLKGVSKVTSKYDEFLLLKSQTIDFSPEAPPITFGTNIGTLSFKPSSLNVKHDDWNNIEYRLSDSRLHLKDKDGNMVSLRADSIKVTRGTGGELYQINTGSAVPEFNLGRGEAEDLPLDPPLYARSEANNLSTGKSKETRQERLDKVKTQVESLVTRYSASMQREQNAEILAANANIRAELIRLGREALPAIESVAGQARNPHTARFLADISQTIAKLPLPTESVREIEERSLALFIEKNRPRSVSVTPADKQRLESLIDRMQEPLPGGVVQRDLEQQLSLAERELGDGPKTMLQRLVESELVNSVNAQVLYAKRLTDSADAQDQQKAVEMLTSLVRTNLEVVNDPDFQATASTKAVNDPGFVNALMEEGSKNRINPILLNRLLDHIKTITRSRIKNGA